MGNLISAIVPAYRRGEELERTLFPSLKSQVSPPLEIIIVDDTEDDSVRLVCERWSASFADAGVRLRYVRNGGRRSAARARNMGASLAEGELLLFLDSDVVLSPDYVKEIASAFHDRPDAVGIQGLIVNWAESPLARRFLSQYGAPGSSKYGIASRIARGLLGATVPSANSCRLFEYPIVLDDAMECQWLSGSNMCVSKSAFRFSGFDEGLEGYSLGEDILLSRKLTGMGKLYITTRARCSHMFSGTGNPERSRLGKAEHTFFHRLYGFRGDLIYYSRSILFPLLGYSGDAGPQP
jgi:GT2 family glycosyltransferase